MQSKPVNLLLCKFTSYLMFSSLFGDSAIMLFHFLLRGKEGKKEMMFWSSPLIGCELYQ